MSMNIGAFSRIPRVLFRDLENRVTLLLCREPEDTAMGDALNPIVDLWKLLM